MRYPMNRQKLIPDFQPAADKVGKAAEKVGQAADRLQFEAIKAKYQEGCRDGAIVTGLVLIALYLLAGLRRGK